MRGFARQAIVCAILILGASGCTAGLDTASNVSSLAQDAPAPASDHPTRTSSPRPSVATPPNLDLDRKADGRDISCEELTGQPDCAERIQEAIKAWKTDPRIQTELQNYLNSQLADSQLKGCSFEPKTPAEMSADAARPSLQDRIGWPGHDTGKEEDTPSVPQLTLRCPR